MQRKSALMVTIAVLAGIVIGAVSSFIWQKHTPVSSAAIESGNASSAVLGAQIMQKIGSRFTAHRRHRDSGISFYDEPKPYGDALCRVNRYYVPEKTLTGKMIRPQDHWEDDLTVGTEYGVWRRPVFGPASDGARDRACRSFRDFDHLFTATSPANPERAALLLDQILTQFRANKLEIPVFCEQVSGAGSKRSCDATRVLKSVKLSDLRGIEQISVVKFSNGERHYDRIILANTQQSCSGHMHLELLVESDQTFGRHSNSEGELRSVRFVFTEQC